MASRGGRRLYSQAGEGSGTQPVGGGGRDVAGQTTAESVHKDVKIFDVSAPVSGAGDDQAQVHPSTSDQALKGRPRRGSRGGGPAPIRETQTSPFRHAARGTHSPSPRRSTPRSTASRGPFAFGPAPSALAPAARPLSTYSAGEETLRNDYALRYAVSGEWSGNWVKYANASGENPGEISAEYPRLRRLLDLKRELLDTYTHPPIYLGFAPFNASFDHPPDAPRLSPPQVGNAASDTSPPPHPGGTGYFPASVTATPSPYMRLTTLLAPHRFTALLIAPPPGTPWARVQALPVRLVSAEQAFVFLWVGCADADGLERGRELLLKWGFRRCEDIVWVRTNRRAVQRRADERKGPWKGDAVGNGLCVPMKEHCLVGIRGTVRRSTDPWLIHANVDTDVIVWDGPDEYDPDGPTHPPQLYDVIENFCLGTRRLEIFGSRRHARQGWVTIGPEDEERAYRVDPEAANAIPMAGSSLEAELRPPEGTVAHLEAEASKLDLEGNAGPARPSTEPGQQGLPGAEVEDWDSLRYDIYISRLRDAMGRYVLPSSDEIDSLRPKTPPQAGARQPSSGPTGGGYGQQMQRQNSGLSTRRDPRGYQGYQHQQHQYPQQQYQQQPQRYQAPQQYAMQHGHYGTNYGMQMPTMSYDTERYSGFYRPGPQAGFMNSMMNDLNGSAQASAMTEMTDMNVMRLQQPINHNIGMQQMQPTDGYGGASVRFGYPQAVQHVMMAGGEVWVQQGGLGGHRQVGELPDWGQGSASGRPGGAGVGGYDSSWGGGGNGEPHDQQQSRQWY